MPPGKEEMGCLRERKAQLNHWVEEEARTSYDIVSDPKSSVPKNTMGVLGDIPAQEYSPSPFNLVFHNLTDISFLLRATQSVLSLLLKWNSNIIINMQGKSNEVI